MTQQKLKGLSSEQVQSSRRKYGDNNIVRQEKQSFFKKFLSNFGDPIIKILLAALGLNLLFFVISVMMAVSINYSIDFLVGTICLYTESIWGINIMKQVVVMLLSGATIPVAFFPEPLKTIAGYLPFCSIYNAPLSVLLEGDPQPQTLLTTLGIQLFWCIAMAAISNLFWRVSLRQITVNGG